MYISVVSKHVKLPPSENNVEITMWPPCIYTLVASSPCCAAGAEPPPRMIVASGT